MTRVVRRSPQRVRDDEFWDTRQYLWSAHQMARASYAAPLATLCGVVVRATTAVHPRVVLPGVKGGSVGREVSLNSMLAICGESGQGKDVADAAAHSTLPVPIRTLGPGSGEGLSHLFLHRAGARGDMQVRQHHMAVLLTVPEIGTIGAISQRNASTLLSEMCKGWMGQPLGFANAAKDKTLPVAPHSYSMGWSIGVQDENANILLDEAPSGVPQRFVWAASADTTAPVVDDTPKMPRPLSWDIADWAGPEYACSTLDDIDVDLDNETGDLISMTVAGPILRIIKEEAVRRLNKKRGDSTRLLGAHTLLRQEKFAAGLALLDERLDINQEDWELASYVMKQSDETCAGVLRAQAALVEQANTARARARGRGRVVEDEAAEETIKDKVRGWIENKLIEIGQKISHSDLRGKLPYKYRTPEHKELFTEVIEEMVEEGLVKSHAGDYHGKDRVLYEWSGAA